MALATELWAVVLAAGDGTRLRELTTGPDGECVPKQFCSVDGGPTLLRRAVSRGVSLAGRERTTAVVARDHQRWWSSQLADLPPENLIVQPCNRGTACGLLLPLLTILRRDPDATLIVLPSDHVVADEDVLAEAVQRACRAVQDGLDSSLILLGVEPDRIDEGYGWVLPGDVAESGSRTVVSFFEKPDDKAAEELMRRGALWNSFIFVAHAQALFALFAGVMPWLVRLFGYATRPNSESETWIPPLDDLFISLPTYDFSQSFLQQAPDQLRVMAVPPCGWSDIGTPKRIGDWVARSEACPLPEQPRRPGEAPLDLAESLRTRQPAVSNPLTGSPTRG